LGAASKAAPESREGLPVESKNRFSFQKTDASSWHCTTSALQPIELGVAMRGP
jgi:hypothetical protein